MHSNLEIPFLGLTCSYCGGANHHFVSSMLIVRVRGTM